MLCDSWFLKVAVFANEDEYHLEVEGFLISDVSMFPKIIRCPTHRRNCHYRSWRMTWRPRSHTPREQPDECRGRIGSGDDVVHLCNAGPRVVQTDLQRLVIVLQEHGFLCCLPTCSAFSTLRRIFEALSGSGNSSSWPASG